ncbi:MAG: hypothetical protein GX970_02305 [Phyllobacteriaceae bacterium]|nr:hypothetical protein [Phyllobacteriaceae bacterium]
MNTFALVEGEHVLVYSTGYSAHREALLAHLRKIVGQRTVSVAIPRPEWASMCNARAIADEFHKNFDQQFVVHQRLINPPHLLLDFDADSVGASSVLAGCQLRMLSSTTRTLVDPNGERGLDFIVPELRLLPTNWAYDSATKTLFTGDAFCWVWKDEETGPWLVDAPETDPTTLERVAHSLSAGRYWWLEGAATQSIRVAIARLFENYEVRFIAPDHGAVIAGEAVSRHVGYLDEYLRLAARNPSIGIEAGQWKTSKMRASA